ncbi:hypothetical protein [Paraburkholderia steynii]|uniref:hypothetical protein n=1 Tax=Paraburkholderia steynii TaxID=1245441 RepID=UPI000B83F087|nr:hypothetical protein [Paraburkholderia steynii]
MTIVSLLFVSKALEEKAHAMKDAGIERLSMDNIRGAADIEETLKRMRAVGSEFDLFNGPTRASPPRQRTQQTNETGPQKRRKQINGSFQRGTAETLDLTKLLRSI